MGAVLLSGLTLTPTPTLTPTLIPNPNPNQVLLSGLAELSGAEMRKLAHVCMNRANWARRVELKDRLVAAPSGGAAATATALAKVQPP